MTSQVYEPKGYLFDYVPADEFANLRDHLDDNTRIVWIESPSNPLLNVVDIRAAADAAHEVGAILVVDNTFATPYLQRPLELGADVVVHSTTKYLGGHSDTVGGFAATNDPTIAERLYFLQKSLGAVPGPFDCWLVLRGIKTLAVRMRQHCENAMGSRSGSSGARKSSASSIPGLPTHPGHAIAARQMRDFGGMVSFLAESEEEAVALAGRTKLFQLAESLGGVESLIEVPAKMTHASTATAPFAAPPNLVRLSVGIESAEDLDRRPRARARAGRRSRVNDAVVFVEIPSGSRNKYEYDQELGGIVLDRRLFTAMAYPADYGYVEGTLAEDGDPLDALVLVSDPTFPGCRIRVRPIGVFHMADEKGPDEKLLCVPLGDPSFERVRDIHDVTAELRDEIEHFFQRYKDLEPAKKTETRGWGNRDEAAADPRRGARSGCVTVSRRPASPRSRALGRCYLLDTEDGPALFDCGPTTTIDALEGRSRRRGLQLDRHPPSAAQPHPPRPRGRGGRARARAPRPPGARLRDRRAASGRARAARAKRAPAVRRRVRHALGRARAGTRGERPRRRRPRPRPRLLPDARPCVAPRLATSTATARSTPAMRPASASSPAASCCRRRRRRNSTSTAWQQTLDELERRDAGPARADPLRRRRRPRRRTSPSSGSSCSTGPTSSRAARPRTSSSPTCRAELADAGEDARLWTGDAALAVVPRPQALDRQVGIGRPGRSAARSRPGRSRRSRARPNPAVVATVSAARDRRHTEAHLVRPGGRVRPRRLLAATRVAPRLPSATNPRDRAHGPRRDGPGTARSRCSARMARSTTDPDCATSAASPSATRACRTQARPRGEALDAARRGMPSRRRAGAAGTAQHRSS